MHHVRARGNSRKYVHWSIIARHIGQHSITISARDHTQTYDVIQQTVDVQFEGNRVSAKVRTVSLSEGRPADQTATVVNIPPANNASISNSVRNVVKLAGMSILLFTAVLESTMSKRLL